MRIDGEVTTGFFFLAMMHLFLSTTGQDVDGFFLFGFTSGRERTAYTPPLLTHQQHFGAESCFFLGAKALSGLEVQRLLHIFSFVWSYLRGEEGVVWTLRCGAVGDKTRGWEAYGLGWMDMMRGWEGGRGVGRLVEEGGCTACIIPNASTERGRHSPREGVSCRESS